LTPLFTDVYSYNFPQDKSIVKFIGKYRIFLHSQWPNDEALAYFVFVAETVQTALTGADVYYWFVQGFGNLERLTEAHFAPIDIPIIHAIVAPLVKGYFCYRILTLNKRLLNLCIVIALVSVQCPLYPNLTLLLGTLHPAYYTFVSRVGMGWNCGKHYMIFLKILTPNARC